MFSLIFYKFIKTKFIMANRKTQTHIPPSTLQVKIDALIQRRIEELRIPAHFKIPHSLQFKLTQRYIPMHANPLPHQDNQTYNHHSKIAA